MLLFRCTDKDEQQKISDRYSKFGMALDFLPEDASAHRRLIEILDDRVEKDFVCLVHKAVTLPESFPQRVADLQTELDLHWPNWGVVGNAGVTPLMYGALASRRVRYFSDSFTGPNVKGHILPSECLFENILLINVGALKNSKFEIPEFHDPHLLAPTLSIQTLRAGRAVLIAPQLACYRNDPIKAEANFRTAVSQQAEEWFAQQISNTTLDVFDGFLDLQATSDGYWFTNRIDTSFQSLLNAQRGRPLVNVDIVTRSRFERPGMLERNISTVGMFIERALHARFVHSIVSDPKFAPILQLDERVNRIVSPISRLGDDRFHLVQEAAKAVRGSYIWFVDDDDWLFPNAAEMISLMVGVSPPGSTFFVDVMHFDEEISAANSISWSTGRSNPHRRFPSSHFAVSLSGQNFVPFCGVIFDRDLLTGISSEVFDRITFFEDYLLVLLALLSDSSFPIALDSVAAGISMRPGDHSATQTDRRPWNESQAELSAVISNGTTGSNLLSLASLMSVDQVGRDIRGRTKLSAPISHRWGRSILRVLRQGLSGFRGGIIWRTAQRSSLIRRVVQWLRRIQT